MRKLWPPLKDIERLLAPPDSAALTESAELCAPVEGDPLPMPDYIHDAIARRVAAVAAYGAQDPSAGLVVRLDALPDARRAWPFAGTLAVLLDQQDSEGRWLGWLATSEADYASDNDVLLEPGDGAFDPSAGVIQLWNRLALRIEGARSVLGQVSPDRLATLRAYARRNQSVSLSPSDSAPGRMRTVTLPEGPLLVGSPIGGVGDPRLAYRHLYATGGAILQSHWQAAVEAMREASPVKLPPKPATTWFGRLFRPGVVVALFAVMALVNIGLMIDRPPSMDESAQVRSVGGGQAARRPAIEVSFTSDAKESDIRALIVEMRGELAGGPGQLGVYRIALPEGNVSEALALAKISPFVASASGKEGVK